MLFRFHEAIIAQTFLFSGKIPSFMPTIRVGHRYHKMPTPAALLQSPTCLVQVLPVERNELSDAFVEYDAAYHGGHYPLPTGRLLILLLATGNGLWTTLRRWTPRKEAYYRSLTGQTVGIEIAEPATPSK
jgi:hypothetical protein